jgi:iron complex outermembrane receptor protein
LITLLQQNQIFATAVNNRVAKNKRWNNLSPREVLSYKLTPDMLGYVSFAKGYKAGGFAGTEPGAEFDPEHIWNVEAGFKAPFPEYNLLLNGSVYHYRYDDVQRLTVIPSTAGFSVPQYQVSNTNQKATGVDLQAEWAPIDNLLLTFNGSYIDSQYTSAKVPIGIDISDQIVYADVSGQPAGEPKVSYSVSGAYTWQEVANGKLTFDVNHGFRGPLRCNDASVYQGKCSLPPNFSLNRAQQRTDLRVDWTINDGRWGVAAFVNNVFDKRYVNGINNVSASVLGTPYAYITPPRMWGVELHAKF